MSNWLENTIGWLNPQAGARRAQARVMMTRLNALSGYDGAGTGRRNQNWNTSNTSSNQELRGALAILRARHRDLVRNNPYAASAVGVLQRNIVGTGIRPRAIAGTDASRKRLQAIMREWCESTAMDFDGRHNLYGLQSLAVRAAMESGDVLLVRVIERDKRQKVPLKVRLLEGDYLDHMKNGAMEGGYAVLGVQFSKDHRRVGYWLHDQHPGQGILGLGMTYPTSKLVPAEDVLHLFEVLRPGQVRGVPRGTAGMERARVLDDYQDARVEAQKSAACLVGLVVDPEGQGSEKPSVLPDKLEPGMFANLGAGQDVRFSSPSGIQDAGGFVETEQHAIAAAYGVPYSAMTGNLKGVNFSSGRMGTLEFKRVIEQYRSQTLLPILCDGIADWFDAAASLAGITLAGVRWEWTPPKYQLQDPAREVKPAIDMVRAGFQSQRGVMRELGMDPDEIMAEIAAERADAEARGLVFDTNPAQVSQQGYEQPSQQQDPLTED